MKPQRKSPRLQDYDYTRMGAYFVTICTHERKLIFGHISDSNVMNISEAGLTAQNRWAAIPDHFPHVEIDSFVVMPNHVHGILLFSDVNAKTLLRTRQCRVPTTESFSQPVKGSLSTVIRSYKSIVTREIHRVTQAQVTVWQARFHDHIIRNEDSLSRIREYVINNPSTWREDVFYEG